MSPQYLTPGVYVEELPSTGMPIQGVATSVAAFIGFTEKGPVGEPKLVTNWDQFTKTYGGFLPGAYLPLSVYGYFNNGGSQAYIIRANNERVLGQAALPARGKPEQQALKFTALKGGPEAQGLKVEIADAAASSDGNSQTRKGGRTTRTFDANAPTGENAPAGDNQPAPAAESQASGTATVSDDTFNVTIRPAKGDPEVYENVSVKPGPNNVATKINAASKLVYVEQLPVDTRLAVADRKPAPASYELPAMETVSPDDFQGDATKRVGLEGLEAVDDVTMVCCPDLMSAYVQGLINEQGVINVQRAIIDHCERMADRMAILDTPPHLDAQAARTWRMETTNFDSKFATMYYPWIKVADPANPNNVVDMPPSGHMAGIWARTDTERGVHKAPANEVVRGAVGLELQLTQGEQAILNPNGVNCIRTFPGQGIRVWGARTLSTVDSSWRYINVRRLFNYMEKSIGQGTAWAVFEPNDLDLWQRLKRNINAFMRGLWNEGALFGATPDQAFYVKCDETTNTPDQIDAGMVVVEIGACPVKPAEFVVIRFQQLPTGWQSGE